MRGRMGTRYTRPMLAAMAPELKLFPLSDAEYAEFVELQVADHARQRVNAGEWTAAEARALAWEATADLRGDALRRAGHAFYKGVEATGARIGWLWVAPAPARLQRYGVDDLARARWL